MTDSLCMMTCSDAAGMGSVIKIASLKDAQPFFQRREWSSKAHNYIGPFWNVTNEAGERVHAGVHIIRQSEFTSINEYIDDMFCTDAILKDPIVDGPSAWGRGKDCVAMADGQVYEISFSEGKPCVSLFPARAPELAQFNYERSRA